MSSINSDFIIKRLTTEELLVFRKLITLFQNVFETNSGSHPENPYLESLLTDQRFVVFAILHKNEVVGGLTAHELPMYYSKNSELFIYDVAISPDFQRQGLGKQLISAAKDHCWQNNIHELFVPVSEKDVHALDFYRSAGGKAEKVVHFNFEA